MTYEEIMKVVKPAVCAKLKSPASAQFPVDIISIVGDDERGYRISGFVDSQNSYGAMIRNDFTAEVYVENGFSIVKSSTVGKQTSNFEIVMERKKKMKKLLALFMTAFLCYTLCACNSETVTVTSEKNETVNEHYEEFVYEPAKNVYEDENVKIEINALTSELFNPGDEKDEFMTYEIKYSLTNKTDEHEITGMSRAPSFGRVSIFCKFKISMIKFRDLWAGWPRIGFPALVHI